jgi:hypothetical protein
MKITRRAALALSALAGAVAAQPPSQAPPAAGNFDEESRHQVETTSQALQHFEIPMSAEPVFEFRA